MHRIITKLFSKTSGHNLSGFKQLHFGEFILHFNVEKKITYIPDREKKKKKKYLNNIM